ncbi:MULTISPECIES: TetR/AcrR family transcriptional regulator [Thalassospira]|jgi:TetR/AcrR family transcriptional repressor of nem operon|uniref:TetR/AcrR family transcriptional regulator n=1 Tax=Thalassospira povalilytica TaxID=732237 RepID=A0ABX4R4P0_9PROT|nr:MULTISPECIES: TetR/AcrR family transcriptional regulator [Thalassospira]MEE3046287.1 TetR/AcrR family transcriptional regulator [Pseudomonadota bacterium]MBO6773058.1 TetR/AcrR family transcriptional regulator [Thalassospira sp.]MCC4241158.1 TetR/AcrR family transcriptional regulator [Thalassospira povalilytica]PKR47856.1 TetR/AcrR family transcriptional regulator [Thalassospira povalilytica]URK17963.1 TetR/AcrR family transcriptional regulator [Thalassospira sp. GO-4]|tara:strand:- start:137 stop:718 length:582 start_codon:yes stop_codon:yes gene_type:complete
MARPRGFDEESVLDNAMNIFWSKGFESTSVQDLVEETGLNRASMYASFGDKKALFLRVLDHYSQKISSERFANLREIEDGREAIEKTFRDTAKTGCAEGKHKGCLIVNSGMELAPHDPETAAIAHQAFRRVEDMFAAALSRGIKHGTISKDKNIRALARFLAGSIQGVQLMSRRGADRETLEDYTNTILEVLN